MGPLEILIVIVIAVIVFGGYKKLPQLGRSAGEGARVGSAKAKELAGQVGDKHGDKFDPAALGRSAGKGVREARDFRDSFKGTLDSPAKDADTEQQPAVPATTPAAPPPQATAPARPAPTTEADMTQDETSDEGTNAPAPEEDPPSSDDQAVEEIAEEADSGTVTDSGAAPDVSDER